MAVNKGLGRGLASLMGLDDLDTNTSGDDASTTTAQSGEINIELADIDANYQQPRKHFDQEALQELSDSIAMHGVIQPIVVTPVGARFMIIAGERRYRASKLAGLKTIPAVVKNYTPQQVKEISIIENLQREDLNPVEAARAIKTLMTEFGLTQETAADRIGKSRSAVANTLRLLTLHEGVLALVEKGRLSAGHARTLVVVPENSQLKLALKGSDNQLNVRDMEKLVRDFLNPKPVETKEAPAPSIELQELVGNMQRTFATRVSAVGNGNKGRIYIDYFTSDDLDRMCELVDNWMKQSFES